MENNLNKEVINEEMYESYLKTFEEEITFCLQEVISRIHSALKLFYSTTIDLQFLEDEKDDLFNLVISAFFRIGNLYENIVELYTKRYDKEFIMFQEGLFKLKDVHPKVFGLNIKFCLNEDTINLQNELKEKNENKDENKNKDLENIEENYENEPTSLKINKILEEKRDEIDEEEENIIKDNKQQNLNISEFLNQNNIDNNKLKNKYFIYENDDINILNKHTDDYLPIRSKTRTSILSKEENNILENISYIGSSKNDYWKNYDPKDPIRNTINNFNNKQYFFPNLNKKLTKNYENMTYYKNETKYVKPYISAINLLKSITKYKTPFEKLVLLAAISDQIMESANNFWKGMEPYIKADYLNIEANDILSIFLYILIQAQMPEILIECKIIDKFTNEFTKSFNLAYNYTSIEASIDYINGIKDITELKNKNEILIDASKEILNKSTEKLTRISLGMTNISNDNP